MPREGFEAEFISYKHPRYPDLVLTEKASLYLLEMSFLIPFCLVFTHLDDWILFQRILLFWPLIDLPQFAPRLLINLPYFSPLRLQLSLPSKAFNYHYHQSARETDKRYDIAWWSSLALYASCSLLVEFWPFHCLLSVRILRTLITFALFPAFPCLNNYSKVRTCYLISYLAWEINSKILYWSWSSTSSAQWHKP